MWVHRFSKSDRALSEVFGVVLIFSFVILTAVGLVAVGFGIFDDTAEASNERVGQDAMTEIDTRLDSVSSSQVETATMFSIPRGTGEDIEAVPDDASVTLTIETDDNGGSLSAGDIAASSMQSTKTFDIGTLVHETSDGQATVYQGGLLFEQEDDVVRILSEPDFDYTGETVEFSAIDISDFDHVSDGDELQAELDLSETERNSDDIEQLIREHQTIGSDIDNPDDIADVDVNITIETAYPESWAVYANQRMTRVPDYDVGDDEITFKFDDLTNGSSGGTGGPVDGAVVGDVSSSTLGFDQDADVDSYDSTEGPYESSKSSSGDIYVNGNNGKIDLKNGATVNGNIFVEEPIEFRRNTRVTGDLNHNSSVRYHSDANTHVGGDVTDSANVPNPSPVTSRINSKQSEIRADNDNESSSAISDTIDALENQNDCPSGLCTLPEGDYYLENLELKGGNKLEFEPNGGTVEVVVEKSMILKNPSEIEVVGDGRVNVYVATDTNTFEMQNNAHVNNTGDNAPQFWTYLKPDYNVELKGGSSFTGVLYGPGGNSKGASISIKASGQDVGKVYGAVVGSLQGVGQSGQIHYDTALTDSGGGGGSSGGTSRPSSVLDISTDVVTVDND